jgi:hypothetical protein
LKIENLLNAPSLFGEKIDIEAQVGLNLLSFKMWLVISKKFKLLSSSKKRICNTVITVLEINAKKQEDILFVRKNTLELLLIKIQIKLLVIALI